MCKDSLNIRNCSIKQRMSKYLQKNFLSYYIGV